MDFLIKLCLSLISVVAMATIVEGYSSGAPFDFCSYNSLWERNIRLQPGHRGVQPQNPRSNTYSIEVGPFNPATNGYRGTFLKINQLTL